MKPSRLVTSGGVRRHTVRGMSKITKAALVGGAAAAAIAATVGVASPAQAYSGYAYAHTVVTWGGTNCIEHSGASNGNPYVLGYGHTCMYSHAAAWDEARSSGQLIGVDPIMGNADWISCTITVDGRFSYSDYASRGDGTDVNCLRTVN